MTCKHRADDPTCSSFPTRYDNAVRIVASKTAEPGTQFEVERVEVVGTHLVMQVSYRACPGCTFEGLKTMVFLNTTPVDALKWKKIDPHFRAANAHPLPREAPPPAARFPSTNEGWHDAIAYAGRKPAGAR